MEIVPRQTLLLAVRAQDEVGEARRRAVAISKQIDLGETTTGKVALVATEMATNLVKHAGGGQLLLRILRSADDAYGVEIISIDRGRGTSRPLEWLRDGYSTAGSSGQGLGAIQRLSHTFDLHSSEGLGSAVLSRIWERPPAVDNLARIGAICVPIDGERECGDAFVVLPGPDRTRVMVADGLGHGTLAASAAEQALRTAEKQVHASLLPALESIHGALRSTRGAAVALADIEPGSHQVQFVGVGNIAAFVVQLGERRGMVSSSGIVGHDARRLHVFQHAWPATGVLVMHSDGLTARWDLNQAVYQTLLGKHPALIAAVLFRDFSRGRDDATIVVVKAAH